MMRYEIKKLFGDDGQEALGIFRQMTIYENLDNLDPDGFNTDDEATAAILLGSIGDRIEAARVSDEEDEEETSDE